MKLADLAWNRSRFDSFDALVAFLASSPARRVLGRSCLLLAGSAEGFGVAAPLPSRRPGV